MKRISKEYKLSAPKVRKVLERRSPRMKSLLFACCIVLVTIQTVNADVAKPKQPEKAARYGLHTSLEIVPDPKAYEAKLQITESDFKSIRAALDGGVADNHAIA